MSSRQRSVTVIGAGLGGLSAAISLAHEGYAVDVYENEPPKDRTLIDLPQVVCTPHLGASTEEAQVSVAVAVGSSSGYW